MFFEVMSSTIRNIIDIDKIQCQEKDATNSILHHAGNACK